MSDIGLIIVFSFGHLSARCVFTQLQTISVMPATPPLFYIGNAGRLGAKITVHFLWEIRVVAGMTNIGHIYLKLGKSYHNDK